MPYLKAKRYATRADWVNRFSRKTRVVLLFVLIAILLLLYRNRVGVRDYLGTYFY